MACEHCEKTRRMLDESMALTRLYGDKFDALMILAKSYADDLSIANATVEGLRLKLRVAEGGWKETMAALDTPDASGR